MKLAALLAVSLPAFALPLHVKEGDVQALAQLTDAQGQPLAEGHYMQQLVGDVLHIEATFDYPDGRKVLEKAQLKLHPQLEQLSWSRVETSGGQPVRRYSMDFATRKATTEHLGEQKHWEETVDVDPGKTFAGIAFNYAIKNLRKELAKGGEIKLHAIGFTPKPRAAEVTVRRYGDDRLRMAGREILADKYIIHPEIPAIAKLFISVPDQFITLEWKPFLLGPLFAEQLGIKDSPYNTQPVRGRYMWRDIERLCEKYGLPWRRPSLFPRNSVLAACAALGGNSHPDFIRAVFRAAFAEDQNIADVQVIATLGGNIDRAQALETKAALRANVNEARRLGLFGAPSFVVSGELFFGQDRLADAIAWACR